MPAISKARLTSIADSILHCRPLAEQAALQALASCRRLALEGQLPVPPILVGMAVTRRSACAYYEGLYGIPFSLPGWSYVTWDNPARRATGIDALLMRLKPDDLDIVLLCGEDALPPEVAADLLGCSPERVTKRCSKVLKALAIEGANVVQLRERVAGYQPEISMAPFSQESKKQAVGLPAQKKTDSAGRNASKKQQADVLQKASTAPLKAKAVSGKGHTAGSGAKYAWAAAGFAFLDAALLLTAIGLAKWSGSFLQMGTPSPSTALVEEAPPASLFDLFYTVQVPDEFRHTERLYSAQMAYDRYENGAGKFIAFTQQVSKKQVAGFNSQAVFYQGFAFNGHPAALRSLGGVLEINWYNEYYCYTISTDLPQEQAVALAESAAIGIVPTSQKIPMELLPMAYTPRLALENNDVVLGPGMAENVYMLENFYHNYEAGNEAHIRIATFQENGVATVADLETRDNRIFYVCDSRRSNEEAPWISGEEFTSMRLTTEDGLQRLLLESPRWEEPLEAAVFQV